MQSISPDTLSALKHSCQALEDKKAEDIQVYDIRGLSNIADFMILATGNSDPHLRALKNHLESIIYDHKIYIMGVDHHPKSGWAIVDGVSFIVNLMLPDKRRHYHLETLFPEAQRIPLNSLLAS